jgi:hypothetical protein
MCTMLCGTSSSRIVTFLPLGLDVTNIVVEDNVLHWVEVCNFGFQSVLVSSDGASLEFFWRLSLVVL